MKSTFFLSLVLIAASVNVYANETIQNKLAALETAAGGRLGISALNTANHTRLQYHAHDRFPTGCTSKLIGVAAVLKQSMQNPTLLDEKITYTKNDLIQWTPITEKHVNDGMTIKELSAAAISYSDNTAMNLLLKKIGGPQGMNAFARSIHDKTFRQDHGWPDEAMSHDEQDSSTPAAMENSLRKIVLGHVLAEPQRAMLLTWLKENTTGDKRIRAGVPNGWIVGDKTGTGFKYGTTNDIAVIWPPKCAPIVIAVYFTTNNEASPKRDDVLASATKLVLAEFAKTDRCLRG